MQTIRYSTGAIVLHWAIAIAVIVNWRIAEAMEHVTPHEAYMDAMAPHKALGMAILLLTVLRLAWRLVKKPPELASTLKPWERTLAKTVHVIFYVLLIGLPLGGWLATSYDGEAIDMWGMFTIPALPVTPNEDFGHEIFDVHAFGGSVMIYLIALHIIGALKHQFFNKDGNLYRMLPWGTPKA